MMLIVPPMEEQAWPTLGPQVCDWLETYLIFGPGDLRGEQYRLDDEKRALVHRIYEVYPKGHAQAGRRRFKRVGISLRKGTAKTEFAAALAACELHPEGPVRCTGWRGNQPIGSGVRDPYIPMLAYTEEQSEELAYHALYVMVSEGPLADYFDIGLQRIMRKNGDGKAVALATAPDSRDGARTTFQVFDETHRLTLPRQKEAHQTMLANIPKRKMADAWSLEITTAPSPGEGSVAEGTMDYARAVTAGKAADSRLFFFHRQAGEQHDLDTEEGARAAVLEASGPLAEWSDIDGIIELWRDPTTDRNYWERVWTNRLVRAAGHAFDAEKWKGLSEKRQLPPSARYITLGFDGSRWNDSTALVATDIETGYQWIAGLWERPESAKEWAVPEAEVDEAVKAAFETWNVWALYADPFFWHERIAIWAGRYGDRVKEWRTDRPRAMATALRGFANAINAGLLKHSGDARLSAHIGNSVRRMLTITDEDGTPLWVIQKERPDSPHKIDAAVASVLSWEARNDAIAEGVTGRSVYEDRGILVL